MKIIDCTQGSAEWHRLRQHRLTASRLDVILNGTPLAWSRLAKEMHARKSAPIHAKAIAWGNEHEPQARATYTLQTGRAVRKVGFIVGTDARYGCSPDGLLGRYGMVEIKCPYNPDRHEATWRSKQVPTEYVPQVQGGLWIAERRWCDYVSFDPRVLGKNRIVVVRVERDDAFIARIAERCAVFWQLYVSRKDPAVHLAKLAPRKLF